MAGVKLAKSLLASTKIFFGLIIPRKTSNLKKFRINRIKDFLINFACAQSVFLTRIIEVSDNYKNHINKKQLQDSGNISKCSFIDTLSKQLLHTKYIEAFFNRYLSYISKFVPSLQKGLSIKKRLEQTFFCIMDGTDIQKPYAKKMEKRTKLRDGSKSNSKKCTTGYGYYAEVMIGILNNYIIPLALNLVMPKNKIDGLKNCLKNGFKDNLTLLKKFGFIKKIILLLDRGYYGVDTQKELQKAGVQYIIRGKLSGYIASVYEFEKYEKIFPTYLSKINLFVPIKEYGKYNKLKRKDIPDSDLQITYFECYQKGDNFPKNRKNVVKSTMILIRKKDNNLMEDPDEEIGSKKYQENILSLVTNISISSINDAIFVFYAYKKRWEIEKYIRFIKQQYGLEKIRLKSFQKLKNLLALIPMVTMCNYTFNDTINYGTNFFGNNGIIQNNNLIKTQYNFFIKLKNLKINIMSFSEFLKQKTVSYIFERLEKIGFVN